MNFRRHRLLTTLVVAGLAVGATACGGDDDAADAPPDSDATPAATTEPSAEVDPEVTTAPEDTSVDDSAPSTMAEPTTPDTTAAPTAPEYEAEVVWAGPGGDLAVAYQAAMAPFFDGTDIELIYAEGLTSDNLARVAASRSDPEIDLFSGTIETYLEGLDQGLWQELDPAIVTELATYPEASILTGGAGVAVGQNPPVIFYNTEKYAEAGIEPPTDWTDLFAHEELRGHVAFPHIDNGFMSSYLAMRSEQLAGTAANPTPALEEILANGRDFVFEFPRTPAEMGQLVTTGQVWAGLNGATRTQDLIDEGYPIEIVIPDTVPAIPNIFALVKDAKNPIAAQGMINYAITTDGQAARADNAKQPPVLEVELSDETPTWVETIVPHITAWDYQVVRDNTEAWQTAWAELIGG